MPEYKERNSWGPMPFAACLLGRRHKNELRRQSVDQTRRTAYTHHIQRLMVTKDLALLLGYYGALNEWYLSVYADAIEWFNAEHTGWSLMLMGD